MSLWSNFSAGFKLFDLSNITSTLPKNDRLQEAQIRRYNSSFSQDPGLLAERFVPKISHLRQIPQFDLAGLAYLHLKKALIVRYVDENGLFPLKGALSRLSEAK